MKNRIVTIAVLAGIGFIVSSSALNESHSGKTSGSPVASANAPLEGTCATMQGCHSDATVNIGGEITVGNGNGYYVPGQTYTVNFKLVVEGVNKFGFQGIPLVNSDTTMAGNWTVTNPTRTQAIEDLQQNFPDRWWATHTGLGTAPTSSNTGSWSLDWTAPSTNVGPITFYAAFIAADYDATELGDQLYLVEQVINPAPPTNIEEEIDQPSFNAYPVPAKENFNIGYELTEKSKVSLYLVGTDGKIVSLMNDVKEKGSYNETMNVTGIAAGNYYLHMSINQKTFTEKFIVL